jgi:hypothetical protein
LSEKKYQWKSRSARQGVEFGGESNGRSGGSGSTISGKGQPAWCFKQGNTSGGESTTNWSITAQAELGSSTTGVAQGDMLGTCHRAGFKVEEQVDAPNGWIFGSLSRPRMSKMGRQAS